MAETWTVIGTEDDPDSGHEAVEKGRVYRDNDDALSWSIQSVQDKIIGPQNLNQTFPNVVATGCKVKFFKSGYTNKISFWFHFARTGLTGSARMWAKIRFNNNPSLETSLFDSNVSAPPWQVVGFDISSLAEGWYDAEIYAGTADANGTNMTLRLPSGWVGSEIESPGDRQYSTVETHEPVWSSSPSSVISDSDLTVDEGHTQLIGQAWYDRDEKLRKKPFNLEIAEKAAGTSGAGTVHSSVITTYVPRWANTLHVWWEAYKTTGSVAVDLRVNGDPTTLPYRLPDFEISGNPAIPSGAYDGTIVETQVNVSNHRGKVINLDLFLINTSVGENLFVRILNTQRQGEWSTLRPLVSVTNGSEDETAIEWREWPLVARQQNALLHSGWWSRMTNRDLELQERMITNRSIWSEAVTGTPAFFQIADSRIEFTQPKGAGASGMEAYMMIEVTSFPLEGIFNLNYGDLTGSISRDVVLPNGEHILRMPLLQARDGSSQSVAVNYFAAGQSGGIIRLNEHIKPMFGLRFP